MNIKKLSYTHSNQYQTRKPFRQWKEMIGFSIMFGSAVCTGASIKNTLPHDLLIPISYAEQAELLSRPEQTPSPTPQPKPYQLTVRDKVVLAAIHDFGIENAYAIDKLVNQESGFNPKAINTESGACGLFQALPCSKLPCNLEDVDCQIKWGMQYIKDRYETPNAAWSFHLVNNWY